MLLPLTKTQNFLAMIQKWILPGSWRPVMHVDDVTRLGLVGGREGGSGFIWNTPLLSILFLNAVSTLSGSHPPLSRGTNK
ncbi:hypothetical protein TNCT_220721 [Trichonephila clavata]|uniref:Uncharacterized protein n=1 Tax=Trichonephila clavata TaxID=2740835 RepID=A0A8X6H9X8_TRICU|nr:hypothetical protein TNCT_220721 [Trichonephila clavata]